MKRKEGIRKLLDTVAMVLTAAILIVLIGALIQRAGLLPGEDEGYRIAFISEWEGDPEVYLMDLSLIHI